MQPLSKLTLLLSGSNMTQITKSNEYKIFLWQILVHDCRDMQKQSLLAHWAILHLLLSNFTFIHIYLWQYILGPSSTFHSWYWMRNCIPQKEKRTIPTRNCHIGHFCNVFPLLQVSNVWYWVLKNDAIVCYKMFEKTPKCQISVAKNIHCNTIVFSAYIVIFLS